MWPSLKSYQIFKDTFTYPYSGAKMNCFTTGHSQTHSSQQLHSISTDCFLVCASNSILITWMIEIINSAAAEKEHFDK